METKSNNNLQCNETTQIKNTTEPDKQKQQDFVQGFCPICDKMTLFVSHSDKPTLFICIETSCFGYTTSNLKNKSPLSEKISPYTGLFGVRKKGIKIKKVGKEWCVKNDL